MSLIETASPQRNQGSALSRAFSEGLARTPLDHYVLWTGQDACGRAGSLRARAFGCLSESGVPISLRMFLQRVAIAEGLEPDAVRGAIRQHQTAKPTVLLLLSRLPSGDYVAVTDVPFAGAVNQRLRAGEIVVDRSGALRLGALPTAA
jgi:hypothetical protein